MDISKWLMLFMLWPVVVSGAPVIDPNGISGEFSHGETVTITGSGFGEKDPAAPVLWDPIDGSPGYEGLSEGQAARTKETGCPECVWYETVVEDNVPYYHNTGFGVRVSGEANYYIEKSGAFRKTYNSEEVPITWPSWDNKKVVYISGWWMSNRCLVDQGMGDVTNKLLRLWPDTNGTLGRTSWLTEKTRRRISDGAGGLAGAWYYYNYPPEFDPDCGMLTPNQWSFLEFTTYNNSIDHSGGGRLVLRRDNRHVMETGDDLATLNGPYDVIWAIGSNPTPKEGYHDDTIIYIDNIYIDNTLSRVILGDESYFSSCTLFEMQIPTAWSDSEISYTCNPGSFSPGSEAFLYVFNRDGDVNSSGTPVIIGEGNIVVPTICQPTSLQEQ